MISRSSFVRAGCVLGAVFALGACSGGSGPTAADGHSPTPPSGTSSPHKSSQSSQPTSSAVAGFASGAPSVQPTVTSDPSAPAPEETRFGGSAAGTAFTAAIPVDWTNITTAAKQTDADTVLCLVHRDGWFAQIDVRAVPSGSDVLGPAQLDQDLPRVVKQVTPDKLTPLEPLNVGYDGMTGGSADWTVAGRHLRYTVYLTSHEGIGYRFEMIVDPAYQRTVFNWLGQFLNHWSWKT